MDNLAIFQQAREAIGLQLNCNRCNKCPQDKKDRAEIKRCCTIQAQEAHIAPSKIRIAMHL